MGKGEVEVGSATFLTQDLEAKRCRNEMLQKY